MPVDEPNVGDLSIRTTLHSRGKFFSYNPTKILDHLRIPSRGQ